MENINELIFLKRWTDDTSARPTSPVRQNEQINDTKFSKHVWSEA